MAQPLVTVVLGWSSKNTFQCPLCHVDVVGPKDEHLRSNRHFQKVLGLSLPARLAYDYLANNAETLLSKGRDSEPHDKTLKKVRVRIRHERAVPAQPSQFELFDQPPEVDPLDAALAKSLETWEEVNHEHIVDQMMACIQLNAVELSNRP